LILALPESLNGEITSYKVEGIGYDFIPTVLDRALVDDWVKTVDKESFVMSRRLIREEGMLVGGSAGSTMAAAVKIAKTLKKGQRMVVLFADSVRNYMTKFLNDGWMVENQFMEPSVDPAHKNEWWSTRPVSDLQLNTPHVVGPNVTCADCIDILNKNGIDQIPALDDNGTILGMVTLGNLTSQILSGRVKPSDSISKVLYRQFVMVPKNTPLAALSKIFDKDHFVIVTTQQKSYTSPQTVTEKTILHGIATRIDLLNYILQHDAQGNRKTQQ